VSIHDNVFVDASSAAIALQDHDLPLRAARVYNNTIYVAATGIRVSGTMDQGVHVRGNLVFAETGLSGTPTSQADNLFLPVGDAAQYVAAPGTQLGSMDFYPLPGMCTGSALDLSLFMQDRDWDRDFNGTSKGDFIFRGAYAGSGENPGWALNEDIKGTGMQDAGTPDADAEDADADTGGDVPDASSHVPSGNSGGCSCRQTGASGHFGFWPMLLAGAVLRFRHKKRQYNPAKLDNPLF
jgi:hypothetical protein